MVNLAKHIHKHIYSRLEGDDVNDTHPLTSEACDLGINPNIYSHN